MLLLSNFNENTIERLYNNSPNNKWKKKIEKENM